MSMYASGFISLQGLNRKRVQSSTPEKSRRMEIDTIMKQAQVMRQAQEPASYFFARPGAASLDVEMEPACTAAYLCNGWDRWSQDCHYPI
jgi:hypothetical protein